MRSQDDLWQAAEHHHLKRRYRLGRERLPPMRTAPDEPPMRGRHNPQYTMLAFVDLDERVSPDHSLGNFAETKHALHHARIEWNSSRDRK